MDMSAAYRMDTENPNNLSFWFPKVKDCGLSVPHTGIYVLPENVYAAMMWAFYEEPIPDGERILKSWFQNTVVAEMRPHSLYFVKNGTFSYKFDFSSCCTTAERAYRSFLDINYAAVCASMVEGAGGYSEFIVRELIPYNDRTTPCIYNGMPLRTEVRVFYDFDTREVLYATNYWDYDYVRPHLKVRTDRIIFDQMKDELREQYASVEADVIQCVGEAMADVQLTGRWSVDVLVAGKGKYWLIDMAAAEKSAYWKYAPDGSLLPPPEPFDPEAERKKEQEERDRYELFVAVRPG